LFTAIGLSLLNFVEECYFDFIIRRLFIRFIIYIFLMSILLLYFHPIFILILYHIRYFFRKVSHSMSLFVNYHLFHAKVCVRFILSFITILIFMLVFGYQIILIYYFFIKEHFPFNFIFFKVYLSFF
jgi:hypothetical protein